MVIQYNNTDMQGIVNLEEAIDIRTMAQLIWWGVRKSQKTTIGDIIDSYPTTDPIKWFSFRGGKGGGKKSDKRLSNYIQEFRHVVAS